MPRALTVQEKCRQCDKLLEKGKNIVLSQGMKRVSVDEITKAAGMAKGLFYQHFESKEDYLLRLIWYIHEQLFSQAEQMILSQKDLRTDTRGFLISLFNMPELAFFIKNHHDIDELVTSMPAGDAESASKQETEMFGKLLKLAGINTEKVKPGVVNNYLHILFIMRGSDLMVKKDLQETFDHMIDSLVSYIFGGVA